jgi:aspartyl-tRNA(Asn)/glutamyl-tRNA(Gln) amidotransferase subunit A
MTIRELQTKLAGGEMSAAEVVGQYCATIKKKDKKIGAFLDVYEDAAEQAASKEGPLTGVPVAVKDNILVQGKPATAGSKILKNYTAAYDATVVKRLKGAGAVIIGKTNLDEFGMGSSTENSGFHPTKNPLDEDRVPGGSSGGSAAAVAADMAMVALGSDTGGSVRQPSAFCGVVGLKPTYGAVSRYGLIALASSLDQIGPFGKSVEDVSAVFDVMAGHDPFDTTSVDRELKTVKDPKKLKIGIPKEYFVDGMSKEVKKGIETVIEKFEKEGFSISEVSLPHTKHALSVYYIIMPAEASANLARFDGIRYSRIDELKDKHLPLLDLYNTQRGDGFGEESTRRILLGTFVLSSGYYDAYYTKAQKVRRLITQDFESVFDDVDVLLTPVTPTTAFKLGEKVDDPMEMYLSDIFTIPASLAGLPALSLPSGITDSNGLPIGFQLVGKHFSDKDVLSLGEYYQTNIQDHD